MKEGRIFYLNYQDMGMYKFLESILSFCMYIFLVIPILINLGLCLMDEFQRPMYCM
jgi:hypothetical protein